jgi:hypothetical protein
MGALEVVVEGAERRNAVVIRGLDPRIHHRIKPGDDESSAGLRSHFAGQGKISPEFGWIATISKPIFRASIKLTIWGDGIWSYRSQP